MSLKWHVEDNTGKRITEADLNFEMENVTWCQDSDSDYTSYESDTEEPEGGLLVRWFNILHHFIAVAEMDLGEVWSLVRRVKTRRLWKDQADCVDQTQWEPKQYLKHGGIEILLDDIDEGGIMDDKARLNPGDLSDELWRSGFTMFLHLAYCPDPLTEAWAQFYEQTLALSPVRSIVEKIGAATRSKADSGVLTTEVALFKSLRRMIPFKVGNAALALSTAEQLESSLHLPMLAPYRPTILACLNEGSCEDFEKEVEKVTRNDYEKKKPFECSLCRYKSGIKSHLNRHIATVHEKKKPFECSMCAYKCGSKSDLNKHIFAVHEKKKPFMCSICPSKFSQRGSLNNHIARVHEKKKPFACSICPFRFFDSYGLKDKHERAGLLRHCSWIDSI